MYYYLLGYTVSNVTICLLGIHQTKISISHPIMQLLIGRIKDKDFYVINFFILIMILSIYLLLIFFCTI